MKDALIKAWGPTIFGEKKPPMTRTAGEVRFIKDKSEGGEWGDTGASERQITPDYAFQPKKVKCLAKVLRSTNAALGHALSAYSTFSKVRSADVSPDGCLGGKGYVFRINEMRKAYMNAVEAFSSLSDTLYDEVQAPHWSAVSRQESPEEKEEVAQIIEDAEDIKKDPESWAEEQEEEMDEQHTSPKTARKKTASLYEPKASRVALRFMRQKHD